MTEDEAALYATLGELVVELRALACQFAQIQRDLSKPPALKRGPFGKVDRNALVIDDFRTGVSVAELAERYGVSKQRVSQILKKAGESPAEVRDRRIAEDRQRRLDGRPWVTCKVCGNDFQRSAKSTRPCSDACAEAWRLGRRYFDPDFFERERRLQGRGETPPNRRYARQDSKTKRALLAVGRGDLLPPRGPDRTPKNQPPCSATNLNGQACRRNAQEGETLCHIHLAASEGRSLGGGRRLRSAS